MPNDAKPDVPATPVQSQVFAVRHPITNALILVTAFSSFVADRFWRDFAPFGAGFGTKTLGGEWWRLLTANFVHKSFFPHLLGNLFFLWFFGKRMERILGKWTFLLFYLSCGVACHIVSIAARPEAVGYGASGAVFGLAGGLASAYALRVERFSKRELWKIGLAALWSIWVIYAGLSTPEIDGAGHVGGLLVGITLGALLLSDQKRSTLRQGWVFAGMAVILLLGAISVRRYYGYIVHLNFADQAIDEGRRDVALQELRIALRMKPESELGHSLVRLTKSRLGYGDDCSELGPRPDFFVHVNPCEGKECDGRVHTTQGQHGRRISYQGHLETSPPHSVDGSLETTTTATVMAQVLDEFGEIDCTVSWSNVSRQRLNVKGVASGMPIQVSASYGTIADFDPVAVEMKKETLAARQ